MTAAIVSGPPSVDERGDFLVALLHWCECEHERYGTRHLARDCMESSLGCVMVASCPLHIELTEHNQAWLEQKLGRALFFRRIRERLLAEEFGCRAA